MTIEFSMFSAFNSGSTPKNWPRSSVNVQALYCKAEGKAKGGGSVAITEGSQVVQTMAGESLLWQMRIDRYHPKLPGAAGFGYPV
jgi:hypothetical protein